MVTFIPYIATIFVSICCWFALFNLPDTNRFSCLYDTKLQLVFFTAFLTVGSFLLAMKAFILIRIRDDIYRHEKYKERYLLQYDNQYKGDYYKGLLDLGNLLVVSVAGAFFTSIAQITIGFSKIYPIKCIAPSLVGGMLVLVLFDWLFVYLNLRDWFEFIESDIEKELKEKKETL
ncbi:hypothetical protein Despr_2454 [Desulfobulbus propionicus DSM 2032]|uniref:Uncharacterized protein n=1 Tax=Desulfobulbus propionicus (strain ATCC 33891 / DSM 2032 / VKM B-1956 / 1pr3) TaxID=577650 RepID=A0A7U3YNP7_DESPD|nr:hypothetical protein [Desulfobulbus propionicus]ADW18593.1 hypothetical protein Despr_2454 [Desulfobulbus propionicus DSM 2032]